MPSDTRWYPVSPANHTDLAPDLIAQEAQSVRPLSSGFRKEPCWVGRHETRTEMRSTSSEPVLGLVVVVRFRIILASSHQSISVTVLIPLSWNHFPTPRHTKKWAWGYLRTREVVRVIVAYENGVEEREIGWVAGRGREALTSLPRYVCALQATFQGLENQSHPLYLEFPR
jgi:hypothetical protein